MKVYDDLVAFWAVAHKHAPLNPKDQAESSLHKDKTLRLT